LTLICAVNIYSWITKMQIM